MFVLMGVNKLRCYTHTHTHILIPLILWPLLSECSRFSLEASQQKLFTFKTTVTDAASIFSPPPPAAAIHREKDPRPSLPSSSLSSTSHSPLASPRTLHGTTEAASERPGAFAIALHHATSTRRPPQLPAQRHTRMSVNDYSTSAREEECNIIEKSCSGGRRALISEAFLYRLVLFACKLTNPGV